MPSIKSARVARGILLPAICTSAGALMKRNALTKLSVCSAILFLSAISFSTAHAQQKKFAVGTASASLRKKITGFLEVPAGVDPGTNIPVVVVRGIKPGPVLALVSGLHGTEYTSIVAVERLISILQPSEISGTVILIPLVNLPSFEQKVPHLNPVDKKSMNRFYPGNPHGTQTERVSWAITEQVVDQCDYLIDFHGGISTRIYAPTLIGRRQVRRSRTRFRATWSWLSASTTSSFGMIARKTPRSISTTLHQSVASRRWP